MVPFEIFLPKHFDTIVMYIWK